VIIRTSNISELQAALGPMSAHFIRQGQILLKQQNSGVPMTNSELQLHVQSLFVRLEELVRALDILTNELMRQSADRRPSPASQRGGLPGRTFAPGFGT